MFTGKQIQALISSLERRDACLFHACQLQDLVTYLLLGGVASRGSMTKGRAPFTTFDTDAQDAVNGVWDKVFVNLRDFGTTFARQKRAVPNPYGPVLLQLAPNALAHAHDVAIALRSAGGRDFDREAESLSTLAEVDVLFENPDSSSTLFADSLRDRFPNRDVGSAPEVSLTVDRGVLPLDELVVVIVDPIKVCAYPLAEWVRAAFARHEYDPKVVERVAHPALRPRYAALADYAGKAITPSLVDFGERHPEHSGWAAGLLEIDLDYQFSRYCRYLAEGTLRVEL